MGSYGPIPHPELREQGSAGHHGDQRSYAPAHVHERSYGELSDAHGGSGRGR
jgi:hypothetical protein